jgi:DNA-binding transcriptional LysR family regulator
MAHWNLEHLRLFLKTAELRSFSAVAREQHKAQSAVSNAIASLEAGRQQLARHRQLPMSPQQSDYPGGEAVSPQVWRADSFYAMAELLMRGLGWAWLPRHVVQYPTYRAHMIELACDFGPPALIVELAWRRDEPLGPAAQWLAERFAQHLQAIG